jgi:predicted enzyme related to lactoylglutathione lyase
VSELCWISLQVADLPRARFFWRDVIGLPEQSAAPEWVELTLRSGLALALHPAFHPPALNRRGYDRGGAMLGIRVDDLAAKIRLVEQHGGRALGAPHEVPGGRAQDFECPDGYVFELAQYI